MPGIDFVQIASRLTAEEFARAEGLPMRGHRTKCPFHGGENYNLAFYSDGCYCHTCHKRADVIDLAAAVWSVSKLEAANMLNEQFSLGVAGSMPTAEEKRRSEKRLSVRIAKLTEAKQALNTAQEELESAAHDLKQCDYGSKEYQAALKKQNDCLAWRRLKRAELANIEAQEGGTT